MPSPSVVYLALGTRRVQAARRLTAQAAATGADVQLVVPDSAAWRDLKPIPGVTLRRLPAPTPQSAARRLLADAAAASVLVAGDAPALPVAAAVGRRRADLTVVVEPDAASGRRPAAADLAVLTPWYPSPNDDFAGAFVRATTDTVRSEFPRVSVLHTEGWFYPASEAVRSKVDAAADRISAVTVVDTQQGELSRIAVPSVTSAGYPAWMDDHVRAMRAALPTGRIEAPVIHAHTGIYGGVAAAALARPDARVVLIEHATFLPRVFRRPAARHRYAAALDRADAVLCVGPGLRDYLAAEFPPYAGKLHVVPNPIDFDTFAVRERPPDDLHRWLYVGRLVEHKGVRLLLEAFGTVAAEDPAPTLTLVGSGPLESELRERAATLGVGDRVRLHSPVPPDQVPALVAAHDLLVHLSSVETFGLTVVEAVATGTPVLVARNEGTSETMAGLDGRAGLVIDAGADPSAVVAAYRDLRRRLPDLDLPGARDELRARYGREAVAARLRHFSTGGPHRRMSHGVNQGVPARSVPDVSVVIAVYNTMPYLTRCLTSVLRQSLGPDRLEVIAIDDGSTDGSAAELDAWARRHPGTVTVVHQPNSGGPAAPSNRALEIATGRYVFFLGADDYLGREALERLVATADELNADIVLGRLVGAGGRRVSQAVFAHGNRDDITLADSALPWALSNTKLFRRSLIEDNGLRYPEELRSCSDQPFTLRAVVAATRIAVRADYVFYHAVRRTDSSNITYRTRLDGFLHDTAVVMDTAADVVTDPVARERVLHRHFSWEIAKLLGDRFLAAGRDEQRRVQEGVRRLADAYLSDQIRAGLEVHRRISIVVAQHGTLDDLIAVARHYTEHGLAPVVPDGDRFYAALPGFRDPDRGFPDGWYDASNEIRTLVHQTAPADVRWAYDDDGRRVLVVRWHSAMPGLDRPTDPPARVDAGGCPGRLTLTPGAESGTDVVAEFAVDDLIVNAQRRRRRRIRFTWTTLGRPYADYITGLDLTAAGRIVFRRGLRFYVLHTKYDRDLRLRVVINPVNARRIAGRVAHEWRHRRTTADGYERSRSRS